MSVLSKRQSGQAWESVPTISGSRWGFIGAMIGVFIVVVILLTILICCLCRRKSTSRKMHHASKGSNLATTHPEPTFPRLTRPAEPMVDAEEGHDFMQQSASHPASHNDHYGGYQNDGRNDTQQHRYGNQGYAESQNYQGSNYEQHAGEPEFEPVAAPGVGGYHQNPYQESTSSGSQSGYPHQQAGAYSQSGYPQAGAYPQSAAYPSVAQGQTSYPQPARSQDQYGQAYSSYSPAAHEEEEQLPPAYPAGSVGHTHDLPKSRMPTPGM